jgi:hypothetical protein
MAPRWLREDFMTKYDKELQTGTDEYEKAVEPLDEEPDELDEDRDAQDAEQDNPQ